MEQTFFSPELVQNIVYGLSSTLLLIIAWFVRRMVSKMDGLENAITNGIKEVLELVRSNHDSHSTQIGEINGDIRVIHSRIEPIQPLFDRMRKIEDRTTILELSVERIVYPKEPRE